MQYLISSKGRDVEVEVKTNDKDLATNLAIYLNQVEYINNVTVHDLNEGSIIFDTEIDI